MSTPQPDFPLVHEGFRLFAGPYSKDEQELLMNVLTDLRRGSIACKVLQKDGWTSVYRTPKNMLLTPEPKKKQLKNHDNRTS